jgi:hypothetical protein
VTWIGRGGIRLKKVLRFRHIAPPKEMARQQGAVWEVDAAGMLVREKT